MKCIILISHASYQKEEQFRIPQVNTTVIVCIAIEINLSSFYNYNLSYGSAIWIKISVRASTEINQKAKSFKILAN